jgi:probable phosphoglycerate mutase
VSAFLLVRHAQSTWNASGRWQGQADPPLSEIGEDLSSRAGTRLRREMPFDLVITSDLERARRTGEVLSGPSAPGPGPTRVVEPALREFHVGGWSGLTRAEIGRRWPSELALFDAGRLQAPPDGETRAEFDARVAVAARRVVELIHRHRAARTLIVTHGGVIRAMVRACGLPESPIRNLAGYHGTAGSAGLALSHPVDLLDGEPPEEMAGPLAL